MPKITFYGGAQEVTGSNYLLEASGKKILVDCGMFQGSRFSAERNHENFPYDPREIDALFVTHAHIDHTGRIPRLARAGFRGRIFSTPPTKDFAGLMLEDSLGVLEKEARRNSEQEALYTTDDIVSTMRLWEAVPYGERAEIGGVKARIHNAGHILGSSMIEFEAEGKRIMFTGDLGNAPMPLLNPPDRVENLDALVIESAYGNRVHEDAYGRKLKLERAVEDTVKRGGVLMIPAFALERTQELLYEFNDLVEHGRIPKVPIFLDSPLSIRATDIYKRYSSYFSSEARQLMRSGDDLFQFPGLRKTLATDESKSINDVDGPKIIIAGAGMMQGGRILHHARRYLPDQNSTVLFIGYLAAGSLGRRIVDGETTVSIMGERVAVRAEARSIGGYSAHADTNQLLDFVRTGADTLKKVFVVQGEPAAALFFTQRVRDYLGIMASAPRLGEAKEF